MHHEPCLCGMTYSPPFVSALCAAHCVLRAVLLWMPQDIKALLDLRGLMLGSSPSPNLTTVGTPDLTDWVAGGQPCSTPSCEPCAPTAAPCNAPSPQGQTCSWPYVGCKDGRINRVVLGKAQGHYSYVTWITCGWGTMSIWWEGGVYPVHYAHMTWS